MTQSFLICGTHSATGYSGGRYHAWMMGEALSADGHEVTVWTNAEPAFLDDFERWPGHDRLTVIVDPGFRRPPREKFDWVVIIPDISSPRIRFVKWLSCAARSRARVALLNFESANFFNSFSPSPRDPKMWDTWRMVSRYCDLIISSTEISNRYAKDYYDDAPAACCFVTCQPSVNSVEADCVKPMPDAGRVFVITRFSKSDGAHKGGMDLLRILGEEIRGCRLSLLVGKNGIPDHVRQDLEKSGREHGFEVETLEGLSDHDKFRYLKSARLMVFLSRFEGFGYPPVEAAYCRVPCVASNLEVLQETSGDALIYVDPENPDQVKKAIGEVLSGTVSGAKAAIDKLQDFVSSQSYADRLSKIFDSERFTKRPSITRFYLCCAQIEISCNRLREKYWDKR